MINLSTSKRYGIWLLKLVVFLILLFLIYQQIGKQEEIDFIWTAFQQAFSWKNNVWLGLAILGMGIQWSIEAWKWKYLIHKIEVLSFKNSLKAILCGITLSLFTPNRVGEFGGRILILQKTSKLQAIALTLIGSLSQLIVYILVGLVAISLFFFHYLPNIPSWVAYGITLFSAGAVIFALGLYYNLKLVAGIFHKFKYLEKWKSYIAPITHYDSKALTYILFLSLLRYLFINLQFMLLLHFFNIHLSIFTGFIMINSIFLLQTIIPSIALVELGVRGHVALFFLKYATNNMFNIVVTTFSLWFINLVLPALVGAVLLLLLDIEILFKRQQKP